MTINSQNYGGYMKALKIIGIIILALIALVIVLGLVAPKKYDVSRKVIIDAPGQLVFRQVQYWKNWQAWSPWAEMDSTMQVTFEGVDGTLGSAYQWTGARVGSGKMTNTGIKAGEQIDYHLHFLKPWDSESDGYVRLADTPAGTEVTWGFYGTTPFPWNILNLFLSMDKMLGKDFDRGLQLLKQQVEAQVAAAMKFKINVIDFPAKTYAAIRKQITMDQVQPFLAESYSAIRTAIGKALLPMAGAPCSIYFTWDETTGSTDMAAAIPIPRPKNLGEVTTIQVPAAKAYTIDYFGPYQQIASAYDALDIYFAKNNLTPKQFVIEEYLTDPQQEPDSSKWLTRVYFFAD